MNNEELSIYTYAFILLTENSLKLPDGIVGEVKLIAGDKLAAVVERGLSQAKLPQDEGELIQAVLSHDRVICELFSQTVVLPLRFGTFFVSVAALEEYLTTKQEEYLQLLEDLSGKGEYSLKLIPKAAIKEPVTPDIAGKQYFLAKKQRYQAQQDFITQQAKQYQQIFRLIAQAYPQIKQGSPQGKNERIYFLVKLEEAELLAQQWELWQETCSHWELELTGPLPGYHFVGEAAG